MLELGLHRTGLAGVVPKARNQHAPDKCRSGLSAGTVVMRLPVRPIRSESNAGKMRFFRDECGKNRFLKSHRWVETVGKTGPWPICQRHRTNDYCRHRTVGVSRRTLRPLACGEDRRPAAVAEGCRLFQGGRDRPARLPRPQGHRRPPPAETGQRPAGLQRR